MSTSYTEPFDKFNSSISDAPLFSGLTDQELTELLDIFLSKSKSVYFKNCTKDLSDCQNPDFYTKSFIADGVVNTFVIDKYPVSPNSKAIDLVCKVNYVDITSYTFDEDTLTFTITSTLVDDDVVECGFDFYGQFNETLSDEEEWVLSEGMKLTWLNRQIYKEEKLKDKLSTKDYNNFSPANLLDKLVLLKKETESELLNMVNGYSFNGFEGFN